ncbi:MAG: hypothetical protein WA125_17105 [Desulfosporosinus sp.]
MLSIIDVEKYPGNIWFVDSGCATGADSEGYGQGPDATFLTIDYAVGNCTANNGDLIVVMPGHTEAITAAAGLDLDVAGITIVFLGNGSNRGTVQFGTAVTADMDVDAANITLVNPRFVAAIDALTGPIDVNAAGFTIINGEYFDAAAMATTDCIVTDANATRLKIDGWKYYESTTGTQKQSNIQLNGVDDMELLNIDIRGDFATGNIENVTDEALNVRLKNITLDNLNSSPTPGMVIDANATGIAENVKVRVASGTTYVSNVGKINWGADCEGFSTDGYGGEPIGTAVSSGVEGKVDTIAGYLDSAALEKLTGAADGTGVYPAAVVDDSVIAKILSKSATAAASSYDNTTDSLEAISDALATAYALIDNAALEKLTSAADGTDEYPAAVANDSVIAKILAKGATATASTYNNTTDSLEAISDAITALNNVSTAQVNAEVDTALNTIVPAAPNAGSVNDILSKASGGNTFDKATDSLEALADGLQGGIKTTSMADTTVIPNNNQAVGGLLATATGGAVMVEDIIVQRGAVNAAGPTNYRFSTDNVNGLTGKTAPFGSMILAKFNAQLTSILSVDGVVKQLPYILESGKKLYIDGDDAATTGAVATDFYIKYKRLAAGASLA